MARKQEELVGLSKLLLKQQAKANLVYARLRDSFESDKKFVLHAPCGKTQKPFETGGVRVEVPSFPAVGR